MSLVGLQATDTGKRYEGPAVRLRDVAIKIQGLWHLSAWWAGGGLVSAMILPPRYTVLIGFLPFTLLAFLSLLVVCYRSGLSLALGNSVLGLGVGLWMVGEALATYDPPWHRIGAVYILISGGVVLLAFASGVVYVIRVRWHRGRRGPDPDGHRASPDGRRIG